MRAVGGLVGCLVLVTALGVSSGAAANLPIQAEPLTEYRTCILTATPASTSDVRDATVDENSADTNHGSAAQLELTRRKKRNQRTYLWFDLASCAPNIPPSATVRAATLRLFVTGRPSGCQTVDIFAVPSAWTESGVTWNNQPFGPAVNNPASGARTDSFDVGTSGGCENNQPDTYIVGADVLADVAGFAAGGTNRGWMLRHDDEDVNPERTITFASKENGVVGEAPQLVISWTAGP